MEIEKRRRTGKTKRELAGFGIWKDHHKTKDVDAYIQELRKPRHIDLYRDPDLVFSRKTIRSSSP